MFICDPGFHAALLRQSSGSEERCLRNRKNRKIQSGECLRWDLYDIVRGVMIHASRSRVEVVPGIMYISYLSDLPYFFAYYAYKFKIYFLRNAMMMMIIRSFVKIITTHTHKWKKNLFGHILSTEDYNNIQATISTLPRIACIVIHTSHINNLQYKFYSHTHTHTNKQTHTQTQ